MSPAERTALRALAKDTEAKIRALSPSTESVISRLVSGVLELLELLDERGAAEAERNALVAENAFLRKALDLGRPGECIGVATGEQCVQRDRARMRKAGEVVMRNHDAILAALDAAEVEVERLEACLDREASCYNDNLALRAENALLREGGGMGSADSSRDRKIDEAKTRGTPTDPHACKEKP